MGRTKWVLCPVCPFFRVQLCRAVECLRLAGCHSIPNLLNGVVAKEEMLLRLSVRLYSFPRGMMVPIAGWIHHIHVPARRGLSVGRSCWGLLDDEKFLVNLAELVRTQINSVDDCRELNPFPV